LLYDNSYAVKIHNRSPTLIFSTILGMGGNLSRSAAFLLSGHGELRVLQQSLVSTHACPSEAMETNARSTSIPGRPAVPNGGWQDILPSFIHAPSPNGTSPV